MPFVLSLEGPVNHSSTLKKNFLKNGLRSQGTTVFSKEIIKIEGKNKYYIVSSNTHLCTHSHAPTV